MKSKRDLITLIVATLVMTPNIAHFTIKSFRSDDTLDHVFGYLIGGLYLLMWIMTVVEIIKYRRNRGNEE